MRLKRNEGTKLLAQVDLKSDLCVSKVHSDRVERRKRCLTFLKKKKKEKKSSSIFKFILIVSFVVPHDVTNNTYLILDLIYLIFS